MQWQWTLYVSEFARPRTLDMIDPRLPDIGALLGPLMSKCTPVLTQHLQPEGPNDTISSTNSDYPTAHYKGATSLKYPLFPKSAELGQRRLRRRNPTGQDGLNLAPRC